MKKILYENIYERIPTSQKIINFKNSEKGACYIFGDGKSLKYYNFSSFSNLPSISLGLLSLHKGSKFLNIKYSLNCDSFSLIPGKNIYDYFIRFKSLIRSENPSRALSFLSIIKLMRLGTSSYSKLLFTDNNILFNSNFITHCSNYYFTKFLNNSFYFNHHMKINENLDNQINKNLFNPYESSLNFSIYFAIFLGFTKIYLVGCDYQDIEPMSEHWWEHGEPKLTNMPSKKYIEFMRNFIEIKIITLNKSFGNDFISYRNFSGKSLEYKENNKIICAKKLALLRRQGIYTI
tara:strand:- start:359 stop:1231 length:873 start_codon:yes stop_codon:yes gene_type:complete